MKRKLLTKLTKLSTVAICISLLFTHPSISKESVEVEPGVILVKLKSGVDINAFCQSVPLLQNSITKTLLPKKTVEKATQVFKNRSKNRASLNSDYEIKSKRIESLSRIYMVEIPLAFDPLLISQKINNHENVEYAEPQYKNYIFAESNDPFISSQYYLNKVGAFEAWDYLSGDEEVVIAIVDSGVEFTHVDLIDNLYINMGEYGDGKESNGIDDDGNGYIDDYQGWDFGSDSDPSGFDNDPSPGYFHGTHVAGICTATANNETGIAGVAGVTKYVKFMPIKVASDSPFDRSMNQFSYEGIMYAAVLGADVINCSWGGGGKSITAEDIVNAATDLGSLVIAASGNDNSSDKFYPAGFKNVLSVSSTDANDRKSGFSNYNTYIDVSAPGTAILSTVPGNKYQNSQGTSMASPVAAGVAALIKVMHPEYSPFELKQHLKATSDYIDGKFPVAVRGKMGAGRVNAFRALSESTPISLGIQDLVSSDDDGDNVFAPNDEITLEFQIENYLGDVKGLNIRANNIGSADIDLSGIDLDLGDFTKNEKKPAKISFTLPADTQLDEEIAIQFIFSDEGDFSAGEIITLIANQSYRDIESDELKVTFNSRGNIGFNDFGENVQGVGFIYQNSKNLLYEGALMITANDGNLSNVARNEGSAQDKDFETSKLITVSEDDKKTITNTTYADQSNFNQVGCSVKQTTTHPKESGYRNIAYVSYKVKNNRAYTLEDLYLGIYFDWDIGNAGANNLSWYDNQNEYGKTMKNDEQNLPWVGVCGIDATGFEVFSLDNSGESTSNPGVYDGFTPKEKIDILTGAVKREKSSVVDISMIPKAGPYTIEPGEEQEITFAMFAANGEAALDATKNAAVEYANDNVISSVEHEQIINSVYPNPAQDMIYLELENINSSENIFIFDLDANLIKTFNVLSPKNGFDVSDLQAGVYFIKIGNKAQKFIIEK